MGRGHSDARFLWALRLFTALIGLAALFVAALIVRQLLSLSVEETRKRPPAPAQRQVPAPAAVTPFNDYEIIMKNNPFGPSGGQLRLLTASPQAKSRPSELRLVGTVSGGWHSNYAILSGMGDRQEVLKEGQSLPGVGTLKRVEKDKAVILGDEGPLEIPLADPSRQSESPQPPAKGSEPAGSGKGFVRTLGKGQFIVDQKTILNALEKPNQLMTDARLQPNVVEGRQEGFVLREVRNGGIYQSLGLMNGDVLLRINDYNISNPDNALQAFTALRGMDRVDLDIVRNGTKMTFTYQIQ